MRAADIRFCPLFLERIPATTKSEVFGPPLQDSPVDVILPWRFLIRETSLPISGSHSSLACPTKLTRYKAEGQCDISVEGTGAPMITKWYRVWGAAVAAVGMCAVAGKDGVATIQSRLYVLQIYLQPLF